MKVFTHNIRDPISNTTPVKVVTDLFDSVTTLYTLRLGAL